MKKVIISVCIILLMIPILIGCFYVWGIGAYSKEEKQITFKIEPGTTKTTIAKNLANAGLIKSEYALDIFMMINNPTIQAGEYLLSPSMTPEEMIEKFVNGDVKINTKKTTLVEGKRLVDYAETLASTYTFTKQEFIDKANDREYLTNLVESGKYWFLTNDILNTDIYYPLEGYLYPDTYEFLENITPEEIIETILNHTLTKLEPLKQEIESSSRTVHEYLTMASIVEKEANTKEDREKSAQVFYTRLDNNMSLGSDVTAYYGVRKNMEEAITILELDNQNPYNTRLTDGSMNGKLPIGPIANPSITSIEASLHPADTNYYYFVANVCTGEVFFQEEYQEFIEKVRELQGICEAN